MSAEAEIVAQLQAALAKLDKPVETPAPSVPEEVETDPFHQLPLDPIKAKHELMEFFDIPAWNRSSSDVDTRIAAVLDWATTEAGFLTERPDLSDILKAINDRMRIMGIYNRDDRLNRMWRFTKIQRAHQLLIEKERALNG